MTDWQAVYKEKKQKDGRTLVRLYPKTGRNKPCYCGSCKKFKHCHGGVE